MRLCTGLGRRVWSFGSKFSCCFWRVYRVYSRRGKVYIEMVEQRERRCYESRLGDAEVPANLLFFLGVFGVSGF